MLKLPKINLNKIDPKTLQFLQGHKKFTDYDFWNDDLKMIMAYWIQIAINTTKANIENKEHQHAIKIAIGNAQYNYNDDKPIDELTKLLFTTVKAELERVIKGQPVYSDKPQKAKKPIRTELLPDWFDKATEERRKKDEEEEERRKQLAKDPNYVAEQQKKIREMLSQFNNPQSSGQAQTHI